jgi:hypothetical protein
MFAELHTTVKTHDLNDTGQHSADHILAGRGMHIVSIAGPTAAVPFTDSKRLAAEVLRQAFADLENDESGRIRDEAEAWFESEDDHEHAFVHVCEVLGFDTRNIRAASKDPDRRRTINVRLRREWNEGARK